MHHNFNSTNLIVSKVAPDALNNTRLLEKSNTSMSLYQKADYVKTGTGNFENDFKNTRDLESKKEASPVQQPRADNVKTSKGTYNKNDRKQKAKPNTVEKRLNEIWDGLVVDWGDLGKVL
ncbi:unnamed protein product [Leptidea sinapis]|nr:unnamed protein product [Leptidea sinapis]